MEHISHNVGPRAVRASKQTLICPEYTAFAIKDVSNFKKFLTKPSVED
jgi:hypothetical protein